MCVKMSNISRSSIKYMRIKPWYFTIVPMTFRLGMFLEYMVKDLKGARWTHTNTLRASSWRSEAG
jgi:hypothetical protein